MSYTLKLNILEQLRKQGIITSIFGFNGEFTKEQLDSIEELTITNCDDITGISELVNLKKLTISSSKLDSFKSVSFINEIKDFSELSLLSNLESLTIINDYNIETLDVSNLVNLKIIKIFNAPKLTKIQGLDSLTNLKELVVCDCPIRDIGNIEKFISNTSSTTTNVLDISLTTILKSKKLSSFLKRQYNLGLTNLRFGEHVYFNDEIYTINIYQAIELYNKASRVLKELKLDELEDSEIVFKIYKYIISKLNYDYDGLEYRDKYYKSVNDHNKEEIEYFKRRLFIINSSFGAFTHYKVVCDGYVNMMRYMLTLLNIPSQTVVCQRKNGELHSAIKYKINDKWFYADPEQDKDVQDIKYFNLSKEELEEIYNLTLKEDYEKDGSYGEHTKKFNR